MKDKIVNLLLTKFNYIYCDTCIFESDEDLCDECHRQNIKWNLSKDEAENITAEIIKIIQNVKISPRSYLKNKMDYIIEVGSDGDFGVISFENSKFEIEDVFKKLKNNNFKKVIFFQNTEDEFYAKISFKANNINKDLVDFFIDRIDYDSLKDTCYYLVRK